MKASKMSQHFRLSKRGSKAGLVMNAPAKYAPNFCITYIFSSVNSWFELELFIITIINANFKYGLNKKIKKIELQKLVTCEFLVDWQASSV